MPPKVPKPQLQLQQTGVSAFLRKLEKPISELQRFLSEYPDHAAQFLEHEKTQALQAELAQELAEQAQRTKQLEAAVAVFEGVHMNSSRALGERLAAAEEKAAERERSLQDARRTHREHGEALEREKRRDVDNAAAELAAALERQGARLEKQHSEAVDRSNAQLARVASDMKRQAAEMEKLELINEGLKDRASKLKELQQEFSNIPDDVLCGPLPPSVLSVRPSGYPY